MKEYRARDIMTKKLVTLKPDTHVLEAITKLLEHKISGAPVLDDQGTFVGIFSEKSCMQILVTDRYHEMPNAVVGSYLYPNPKTITEDSDLLEIAQKFLNEPLRRLTVLRDGKVIGQVSRRDVLRAMSQQIAKAGKRPPAQGLYLSAVKENRDEVPLQ